RGNHRLPAELVLFPVALVLGRDADEVAAVCRPHRRLDVRPPQTGEALAREVIAGRGTPIPSWLTSILVRAAGLARDASKPNGQVVQWGDTDSGRLLKLQPAWTEASPAARQGAAWVDDLLDHRALVAAAARLAQDRDLAAFAGEWIDADLVAALAGAGAAPSAPSRPADGIVAHEFEFDGFVASIRTLRDGYQRQLEFPLPGGILDGLERAAYPEFGHYVFRAP